MTPQSLLMGNPYLQQMLGGQGLQLPGPGAIGGPPAIGEGMGPLGSGGFTGSPTAIPGLTGGANMSPYQSQVLGQDPMKGGNGAAGAVGQRNMIPGGPSGTMGGSPMSNPSWLGKQGAGTPSPLGSFNPPRTAYSPTQFVRNPQ